MKNIKTRIQYMAVFISLLMAFYSQSAIIVVDNDGDSSELENNCGLRDALLAASLNVSVDGCSAGDVGLQDVIIIQVPGPIQLESNAIPIFDSVVLSTNIGAPSVKILAASNNRIFRVSAGSNRELSIAMANLELVGGDAEDEGGGAVYFFRNGGSFKDIEFRNMVFENNNAASGGAISLDETSAESLLIVDSEFINNTATAVGGAISGFRFSAVNLPSDAIQINNNLFQNNHSSGSGGAILMNNPGDFSGLFIGNYFIANSSNDSGGVFDLSSFGLSQNVLYKFEKNLFMFNQSGGNGGALLVHTGARARFDYSVFAYNQATGFGGAIHAFKGNSEIQTNIRFTHSTVVHNSASSGDNLSLTSNTFFVANNNIIAYPVNGDNCLGARNPISTSSSNNMISDESCELLNDDLLTKISDPKLSGFTDDPAYFPGFEPTANSPALDRASDIVNTDFNGNDSPMDGNGDNNLFRDFGAHEAPTNTDLIWRDNFGFNFGGAK